MDLRYKLELVHCLSSKWPSPVSKHTAKTSPWNRKQSKQCYASYSFQKKHHEILCWDITTIYLFHFIWIVPLPYHCCNAFHGHSALIHAAGRVMSIKWATTLVAKTCSAIWVVQRLIQNVINLQKQKALKNNFRVKINQSFQFHALRTMSIVNGTFYMILRQKKKLSPCPWQFALLLVGVP